MPTNNPLTFPLSYRWFESTASSRTAASSSEGDEGERRSGSFDGDLVRRAVGEEAALAMGGLEEGGGEWGEEAKDERAAAAQRKGKRKKKLLAGADADAAPTVACCGRQWTRRRLAAVALGAMVGVAVVGFVIALVVYVVLLRTTDGPVLAISKCALVDLAFAGSAVNAVIAIEGSVLNRCRYSIWIDSPDIAVYYPNLDTGAYIGRAVFPSLAVAPHGSKNEAINATFTDVNHAGDGAPATGGLGQQLVKDVLGNQVSTLGLHAAVRAHANVARAPDSYFRMLPRVPVILHLRCQFVNHWGPVGPEEAECKTHIHPFWAKIKV